MREIFTLRATTENEEQPVKNLYYHNLESKRERKREVLKLCNKKQVKYVNVRKYTSHYQRRCYNLLLQMCPAMTGAVFVYCCFNCSSAGTHCV